jgi:hypothetical protein
MEEVLKGFAILNGDSLVVNKIGYISESDIIGYLGKRDEEPYTSLDQVILSEYDETHTYMVYSTDTSITNNQPGMGYKYNESLNAFIPPRQNDTYILNTETFQWEPDPNLEYDLYGDGIKYKWQDGWYKISS